MAPKQLPARAKLKGMSTGSRNPAKYRRPASVPSVRSANGMFAWLHKFLKVVDLRGPVVAIVVNDWTYRDICHRLGGGPPYNDPLRPKLPTTYFMGTRFVIDESLPNGDVYPMTDKEFRGYAAVD